MELTKDVIHYIEERKKDYEDRYNIRIYYWFVRKSTLRGMGRRTSDLDVTFLFVNQGQERREILFERADRRNEFQCWSLETVLDIVVENKRLAMEEKQFQVYNKDEVFQHYVLEYYNGFYCSFGNGLRKDYDGFIEACEDSFLQLYEPLVAAKLVYEDLKSVLRRTDAGYSVSLNQYLNGIWSGLACIHFLKGGQPGDVNINDLAKTYLSESDAELVCTLVRYFRQTIQKQNNYSNTKELNEIGKKLAGRAKDMMENYQVRTIDLELYQSNIKKYFSREA